MKAAPFAQRMKAAIAEARAAGVTILTIKTPDGAAYTFDFNAPSDNISCGETPSDDPWGDRLKKRETGHATQTKPKLP